MLKIEYLCCVTVRYISHVFRFSFFFSITLHSSCKYLKQNQNEFSIQQIFYLDARFGNYFHFITNQMGKIYFAFFYMLIFNNSLLAQNSFFCFPESNEKKIQFINRRIFTNLSHLEMSIQ